MTWSTLEESATTLSGPSALYKPSTERIAELAAMPYHTYLESGEWAETRKHALHAAEHKCERCGTRQRQLDVHHRTYERRGNELPEDLEVLCRPCHQNEHGIY